MMTEPVYARVTMSTSKGSNWLSEQGILGDLMRHFGAADAAIAGAGQLLEQIVGHAVSFVVAATPVLLAWEERLYALSQEPETPGHEKFFREQLGHDLLRAKFMKRVVHHLGKVLADEINQGRRVRAIIDEIAKAKDGSTLVMARRAKRFRDECGSHGASIAIDRATEKAGLSFGAIEFDQLIGAACERHEVACRELGRTAALLAPHLPDKRGRPISVETCVHIMFQRYLEHVGRRSSYTYSEIEDGDYVDPVTLATRLAMNKPSFIPRYATKLRKNKARVPSIRSSVAGN